MQLFILLYNNNKACDQIKTFKLDPSAYLFNER